MAAFGGFPALRYHPSGKQAGTGLFGRILWRWWATRQHQRVSTAPEQASRNCRKPPDNHLKKHIIKNNQKKKQKKAGTAGYRQIILKQQNRPPRRSERTETMLKHLSDWAGRWLTRSLSLMLVLSAITGFFIWLYRQVLDFIWWMNHEVLWAGLKWGTALLVAGTLLRALTAQRKEVRR